MNCKQGDLAILIKDIKCFHYGETASVLTSGIIIKCAQLEYNEGLPAWQPEDEIVRKVKFSCGCVFSFEVRSIGDELLRPLPSLPNEEEELRLLDLSEPA